MGEKHLPAAESGDRQRGRGIKGERARDGMERELGEEWKLRGTASLGKGLKTANTV